MTDPETGQQLVFLTNNFTLPVHTITQIAEVLFFKWIKQHLRIKAFYGTSENAVKTQIWTAVAVYVLVAIKPQYQPQSLHNVTDFERVCFREKFKYLLITYETDQYNQPVDFIRLIVGTLMNRDYLCIFLVYTIVISWHYHLIRYADFNGTIVFKSKKSQGGLPKPVALPDSVKKVDIVKLGNARLITPAGESWDQWFDRPGVSDDFMTEREQPAIQPSES